MDSPLLQSAAHQPSRVRAHSTFTQHPAIDKHGAVHKRSNTNDRHRSISTSQADRLYRLAAEQSNLAQADIAQDPVANGIQWITPQHSPEPQGFAPEQSIQPFPQWTAPTPPRSDSGIPNVSIDSNEEPVTCAPDFNFEQPAVSAEMSSLGFLLPSQYGTEPSYSSEPNNYTMDQNYIPPMRMTQPTTTGGTAAYAQTVSSSPALYQSRGSDSSASRRHSEMPATTSSGAPSGQSYDQSYRRVSNPYDSMSGGNYSVAPSQTIPSISGLTQSPLPSPHMGQGSGGQMMPPYNNSMSRSPNMYDSNVYGQAYTTAPGATQLYPTSQNMSYPPPYGNGAPVNDVMAKQPLGDSSIRVLNQRPKPQCWEHGCNGRQFSTFSNLLRHQREKSGTAAKSYCPKCGAEFTRTTARNGHLAHDKCTKQRRSSDGK